MSNEYPYASMRDSFDLSAYFVVGPEDCKGRPLTDVVDQALHGGATFIQLRAKEADASELTDMARDIAQIIEDNEKSDSVAFVIDDRADVVWQARRKGIKVDGVHIGQTDMEPREARALLGDEAIVGLSAETESLVRLINELPDGCIDYIGAGPLHVSTTKPEASVGGNDGSRQDAGRRPDQHHLRCQRIPGGRGRRRDRSRYGHARRYQGCWLVRGLRHRGCREPGRGRAHHGRRLEGRPRRQEARLRSTRRNPHPRLLILRRSGSGREARFRGH